MPDLNEYWERGFWEGWQAQGTPYPTPNPEAPEMPLVPKGTNDPGNWAFEHGKAKGIVERAKRQAGIS